MYFLELDDGTYINLFGLRRWGEGVDALVLYYPGKIEVVLKGNDAKRAAICLRSFVVHVKGSEQE